MRRVALGILVAVAGVCALGMLMAWLRRGTIDLAFLVPSVERALRRPGAFGVKVGSAELAWDVPDRHLALRVRDVHLVGVRGEPVASVPALELRPSVRALLHGRLALGTVRLVGPRLRLVRTPGGGFDVALGEGGVSGAAVTLRPFVPSDRPGAWLRRLEVRDAEIVAADPGHEMGWRAVGVAMRVDPADGGAMVAFSGEVDVANEVVPVHGDARYGLDPPSVVADVDFAPIVPAAAAALAPADARALITNVALPVGGRLHLELDQGFAPRDIRVDAVGRAGTIGLPDLFPAPLAVSAVRMSAALDVAADTLALETLSVDLPEGRVDLRGTIADFRGTRRIDMEARLARLPVDRLPAYWPTRLAPPARDWVTQRVSGGIVRDGAVRVTGRVADGRFILEDVVGSMMFDGLGVRCLDAMPPARGVGGSGTFTRDRWRLRLARGAVGDLEIVHGTVELDLAARRSVVRAAVRGPVATAVTITQQVRADADLELPTVSGDLTAEVRLDVPLRPTVRADDVNVAVSAEMHDVAVARMLRGWSFSGGDLTLELHDRGLEVVGRGRVEGAAIGLVWRDDLGHRRPRRVEVTARLGSAERTALGLDVRPWLDGPIDVRALLVEENGAGSLDVEADLADATIAVPALAMAKPPGAPGKAEAHVVLANRVATRVEDFSLSAGGGSFAGRAVLGADGMTLGSLDAAATIPARDPARPSGHLTLTLRPASSAHWFTVTSDDAGALFRAISPAAEATGGRLRYAGTLDLGATGLPFDGQLQLHDFRLLRSRLLARVTTLASLSGITSLLEKGQGLSFERLEGRFASRGTRVTITDALASGPAVNLLVSGTVDRADWTGTLRGTLVPSYYGLNAAAGRIPLLGAVVTGTGQQGVHAFDFEVSGPLVSPRVAVNPLASLAPGALRDVARRVPGGRRASPSPGGE